MALINFDDDQPNWISEHEACETLCRDIQSQLVTWEQLPRNSPLYPVLSSKIRLSLQKYNDNISGLSLKLAASRNDNSITLAEKERRSHQIEMLISKYKKLQNQFNKGIQTSINQFENPRTDMARQQLFGNPSQLSRGNAYNQVKTVNWGTESDDEELLDATVYQPSIDQIKQRQAEMIQDQDAGLDALSKIISRQRNIAENLGNEVSLQNDIIDEIGEQMERTDGRIQQETVNIRDISTRDSTCRYWTIIIILFIAILGVGIFG